MFTLGHHPQWSLIYLYFFLFENQQHTNSTFHIYNVCIHLSTLNSSIYKSKQTAHPNPPQEEHISTWKEPIPKDTKIRKKKDALVQAEIEELRLKLLQMEQQQEQDKESIQKSIAEMSPRF